MNAIIANWSGGSENLKGGQESFFFTIADALKLEIVDYPKALSVLLMQDLGQQNPTYRGYVIDSYLKKREILFEPSIYLKNSGIGGHVDLSGPVINIFQDPYAEICDILVKKKLFSSNIEFYNSMTELQRRSAESATKNVAVSRYMKEYMKYLDIECNDIIEHSVDFSFWKEEGDKEFLRKAFGIPQKMKVGIWVGKFIHNKWGPMTEIIRKRQDIFWVLCFSDPVNYRPRLKNVRIFNVLEPDKMRILYTLADFYLCTSWLEAFNLSALEAAGCNRPVIMPSVGFAYNWWNNKLGERVSPDANADELNEMDYSECIDTVIEEDTYHPREIAMQRFPFGNFIESWRSMIESVKNETIQ